MGRAARDKTVGWLWDVGGHPVLGYREVLPAPSGGIPAPKVQALRAARLFDGECPHLLDRPLILVADGRITAVEVGGVEPPPGVPVLDLGDVTLLPGLIDTHVHLGFDAGSDPVGRMVADDDTTLVLRMRHAAARALRAGITTVRDLGDRAFGALSLRTWFQSGEQMGPEIVTSGPPLTVTAGHCHFMGGVADGETELRRAVRARAKKGVDVIKVMAAGGNLTPGTNPVTPQYSDSELAAVVDEAHRFGLPVTAHAHGAVAIRRAVEAGVDGIEHGGFWVEGGVRADPSVIDRMAARGIVVCPTLGIVPAAPPPPPAVASRMDALLGVVGVLHRAGVPLVAGTDAGVAPAKPHDVLPYAVKALADAGLSNVEALKAATSVAAAACGVADRKGRLAPGSDADIVAVGGNPLHDVGALVDVRAVFRGGVRAA